MREHIKKLIDERAGLWDSQKKLLDEAVERGTSLSAEEQAQYDQRDARMTEIDGLADRYLEDEKREKEVTEKYADLRSKAGKEIEERRTEDANNEVRKFLRGDTNNRTMELRASNVVNTDGTITTDPGPRGGYLVAPGFHGSLVEKLLEFSTILTSGVHVFSTGGGEPFIIPKAEGRTTATIVPEATQIGRSNPTFSQTRIGSYKYGNIVEISHEALNDPVIDLAGYIARISGQDIGEVVSNDLMFGDGVEKPTGLMHASSGITVGVNGAGSTPTADELIDLVYSVSEPYCSQPTTKFLMKRENMAAIRKLKDGAQQYIFSPALVAGEPNTLLGYPVVTEKTLPAWGNNANSIVFGDLSQFWVRQVEGIRFERSDDFLFDTDMVAFRCLLRYDSKMIGDSSALKTFKGHA